MFYILCIETDDDDSSSSSSSEEEKSEAEPEKEEPEEPTAPVTTEPAAYGYPTTQTSENVNDTTKTVPLPASLQDPAPVQSNSTQYNYYSYNNPYYWM